MFNWEDAMGQTEDEVERLYLCRGLGSPCQLAIVLLERKVWGPLLELLPLQSTLDKHLHLVICMI